MVKYGTSLIDTSEAKGDIFVARQGFVGSRRYSVPLHTPVLQDSNGAVVLAAVKSTVSTKCLCSRVFSCNMNGHMSPGNCWELMSSFVPWLRQSSVSAPCDQCKRNYALV